MGVLGTINKQCGCIRLWPNGFVPMWGAYIGEDSTKNPYSHDYQPYISETEENTFYVQENYDPMSDTDPIARKHSEDANMTADQLLSLASYVKLVVIRPEDEDNPNTVQMANNNLTLKDLIDFAAPMITAVVLTEGQTTATPMSGDDPLLRGKEIIISFRTAPDAGTTLNSSTGQLTLTEPGQEGQVLTIMYRRKIS